MLANTTTKLLRSALPSFELLVRRQHSNFERSIHISTTRWQGAVTLKVHGRHDEVKAGHEQRLRSQLKNAQRKTQTLKIKEDTPSDREWRIMGEHFNGVQNLEMDTGFNEELNDEKIPLHWPIERLLISSACGEVFRSPFVLEGRVKHLILLLTSGLRFEGPTTDDLCRANKEAIARGETEAEYMTLHKGTPEERKIEITMVPTLVFNWLRNKYTSLDTSSYPAIPIPDQIETEILEVLENDAIDTFTRMTLALPHIVANLKTLNLRSSSGLDFHFTSKEMFQEALPQLTGLETLVFTVGEVFDKDEYLPLLFQHFPPNLSTLRFRGPVSLAKSEHWNKWVKSFADPKYLPNLRRLSFVLDLDYEKEDTGRKKVIRAQEERLSEAKAACKLLFHSVETRGIAIEPFRDEWAEQSKAFEQVDERWEQ